MVHDPAGLEPRAEVDEEEEQEEVAERDETRSDRFAVGRRGERDAAEERADLDPQTDLLGDRAECHRPGDREQHQQVGEAREPVEQRRQGVAREGHEHDEQSRAPCADADERGAGRALRGDGDQHDHDDEVLHDEDSERETAVEVVELASVGEELDHDDGARERDADPHVQRRCGGKPEREGEEEAARRDDRHLGAARGERDRAERTDDVDVELQPDDEEQEGDPELREQLELAARLDEVRRARPDDHADGDVGDHEREPEPDRHRAGRRRDHENRRDLHEHVVGEIQGCEVRAVHRLPEYPVAGRRAPRVNTAPCCGFQRIGSSRAYGDPHRRMPVGTPEARVGEGHARSVRPSP
ncbi:MAG: hypothetical protein M5U27_08890 [Gaiella sp.]|nr:hypothetical protein [Gaiella sp.]